MAKDKKKRHKNAANMVEIVTEMGAPGTTPPRGPNPPPAKQRREQHK